MANENETVMSVCAEWRACIEAADPSVWNDERIAGLVKTTKAQQLEYLARIEAVWKREKAEAEADALAVCGIVEAARHKPGNAAEMREALENIAGYAETARCHTDDIHILSFLGEIEGWARSALSATARRCDFLETPKNETNEQKIWDDYHKWCNNPRNRDIDNYPTRSIVGWLLAPAAERKGDGDA